MKTSVTNILAGLVMAVVLAGVGLIYWAGEQRNTTYGPILLVQDSLDRVWTLADQRLFVLDESGRLEHEFALSGLGIDPSVNAIAAMGSGEILLGARDSGLLYVLNAEGQLEQTLDPAAASAGALLHGMSLAYDAKTERIIVAHTGHHRILVLDRHAKLLFRAGSSDGHAAQFEFPNHLTLGADGRIYVPDTNHHEIEILNADLSPAGSPVPVPAVRGARWPVTVAPLRDGRLAVASLTEGMRRGHVALLATDGKLLKELELPPGAEPIGLLVRDKDLLVTDQNDRNYQLARFALDGSPLGRFGDARFQAALDEAAARHRRYELLRRIGQGVAILAGLMLIGLYYMQRSGEIKRAQEQIQLPAAPQITPAQRVLFGTAMVAGPLLMALLMLWVDAENLPPKIALPALGALMVATLAITVLTVRLVQSEYFYPFVLDQSHRMLRAKLKRMADWDNNETVLAFARTTRGRHAYFLVLTQQRLLLIPILGVFSARIADALPLKSIRFLEFCPVSGWRKWVFGPRASRLVLDRTEMGAKSWELTLQNPAELAVFRPSLEQQFQKARAEAPTARRAPAFAKDQVSGKRPLWSSLLLSALLPGLGHLNQRRNEEGVLFVALSGGLACIAGLMLFVWMERIAAVDGVEVFGMVAMLATYWIWALADVWRYERQLMTVSKSDAR